MKRFRVTKELHLFVEIQCETPEQALALSHLTEVSDWDTCLEDSSIQVCLINEENNLLYPKITVDGTPHFLL